MTLASEQTSLTVPGGLSHLCTEDDAGILVWAAKHDNSGQEGGGVWH